MRRGRSRRSILRGATAARVIAILAAVGCCLAAAAYATTRPAGRGSEEGASRPLRPRIIAHPEAVTVKPTAEFDFAAQGRPPRRAKAGPRPSFECRLDAGAWDECEGPLTLRRIARGTHSFAVRTVNKAGQESPTTAFNWRRVREAKAPAPAKSGAPPTPAPVVTVYPPIEQPGSPPAEVPSEPPVEPPVTGLPFTIEQIGSLEDLLPGSPAQPIGIRIVNPNPEAISIVSITATIAADPPGCPAIENFALTPATLSAGAPFVVAAEATVALPVETDPTIAMVDLPISQDACQAAELEIELSGEASG